MQHVRVLVLGGSGFIGQHLVARLVTQGRFVRVPTRRRNSARDLVMLPTVEVIEADVHDDAALDAQMRDVDAVVNLIGVLHSDRGTPYGKAFATNHVQLPERVAKACRRNGVRRLIQMSALGADSAGPSMYLRSRADGEKAVQAVFAAWPEGELTIFRPSVVFGPEDQFMNKFASLARWFPVIPVAGSGTRMQPVYVGDVVQAIAHALDEPRSIGNTYSLVGPQIYTLGDLVGLAGRWSGHDRPVLPLPMSLGRLQAAFFEMLPGDPLLSRDNLDSLSRDSVYTELQPPELGVTPTPLETIAPGYLSGQHARTRYDGLRRTKDRHSKTH